MLEKKDIPEHLLPALFRLATPIPVDRRLMGQEDPLLSTKWVIGHEFTEHPPKYHTNYCDIPEGCTVEDAAILFPGAIFEVDIHSDEFRLIKRELNTQYGWQVEKFNEWVVLAYEALLFLYACRSLPYMSPDLESMIRGGPIEA